MHTLYYFVKVYNINTQERIIHDISIDIHD